MDIKSLTKSLNNSAIKELNKCHALSIFNYHGWKIYESDISNCDFQNYLDTNPDGIIYTHIEKTWLFFTKKFYTVSHYGISQWEHLLEDIDNTEEDISEASVNTVHDTISSQWENTPLFVMSRDIAHGTFDMDAFGIFFNINKLSELYSYRSRKLVSNKTFNGRYDMIRYYDEHEEDFWDYFVILDFITDGQLDFNFISESDEFSDYYIDESTYIEEFPVEVDGPVNIDVKDSKVTLTID